MSECCKTQVVNAGGVPLGNTIYTNDDTLLGNRTVQMNGNTLEFASGGNTQWLLTPDAFGVGIPKLTFPGIIDPIGVIFSRTGGALLLPTVTEEGLYSSDGTDGETAGHPIWKDNAGTLTDLIDAGLGDNYAEANLTATGDRIHTWDNNRITENFVDGLSTLSINKTADTVGPSMFQVDASDGVADSGLLRLRDGIAVLTATDVDGTSGLTVNSSSQTLLEFAGGTNASRVQLLDTLAIIQVDPNLSATNTGIRITDGDIDLDLTNSTGTLSLNNVQGTLNQVILSDVAGIPSWQNLTSQLLTDLNGLPAGTMLYSDGVNLTTLPVGTAGQVLATNAGATAPEWIANIDQHFANADLIFDTDHTHSLGAFDMTLTGVNGNVNSSYIFDSASGLNFEVDNTLNNRQSLLILTNDGAASLSMSEPASSFSHGVFLDRSGAVMRFNDTLGPMNQFEARDYGLALSLDAGSHLEINGVEGTTGQYLSSTGTATPPVWADLTTMALSDFNLTGIAIGDILYWDGTDWVNLGIGAAGEVLATNAGATAPEWVSGVSANFANTNLTFTGARSHTMGVNSLTLNSVNGSNVSDLDFDPDTGLTIDVTDGANVGQFAVHPNNGLNWTTTEGTVSTSIQNIPVVGSIGLQSTNTAITETSSIFASPLQISLRHDDGGDVNEITLDNGGLDLVFGVNDPLGINGVAGTAGQYFSSNGATANPSWADITTAVITDFDITGVTAGDVLYWDGTDWVNLAIGTAGQVLTTNAGATAPEWATIVTNSVFQDDIFFIQDDVDNTKQFQFESSSITTATTRIYTVQDADGIIGFAEDHEFGDDTTVAPALANAPTDVEIEAFATANDFRDLHIFYTGSDVATDPILSVWHIDFAGDAKLVETAHGAEIATNTIDFTEAAWDGLADYEFPVFSAIYTNNTPHDVEMMFRVNGGHLYLDDVAANMTNLSQVRSTLRIETNLTATPPAAPALSNFMDVLQRINNINNEPVVGTFASSDYAFTVPPTNSVSIAVSMRMLASEGAAWGGTLPASWTGASISVIGGTTQI